MSIRKRRSFLLQWLHNWITHDSKQSKHFLDHLPKLIQFDLLDYPDKFSLQIDRQQYQTRYSLHRESTNIQSDNNPFRTSLNHLNSFHIQNSLLEFSLIQTRVDSDWHAIVDWENHWLKKILNKTSRLISNQQNDVKVNEYPCSDRTTHMYKVICKKRTARDFNLDHLERRRDIQLIEN